MSDPLATLEQDVINIVSEVLSVSDKPVDRESHFQNDLKPIIDTVIATRREIVSRCSRNCATESLPCQMFGPLKAAPVPIVPEITARHEPVPCENSQPDPARIFNG